MGDDYWSGSSLSDLRGFPKPAKVSLGREIDQLERGLMPENYKPLKGLGKGVSGVYENRTSEDGSIFRVACVAKFGDDIVIFHCWNKKPQATSESDKKLIVKRYKEFQEYKR